MRKIYEYYVPSLSEYPELNQLKEINQFTEGDLHGNTARLIESLVRYGVIQIEPSVYQKIMNCYQNALREPENTSNNQILRDLIKKIKIKNPKFVIRLIGDTLADRTGNDLFTLTLIDLLVKEKCDLRILFSNHDMCFINAVMSAKNIKDLRSNCITNTFFSKNNQGISFIRAVDSIERGEITFDEFKRMSQNYFSTLLLLDYATNIDGELEIFSHAPINLLTLQELGEQFGVAYPGDDCDHQNKIKFIDQINIVFRAYIKNGNTQLLDCIFDFGFLNTPASRVIWQREISHTFIDEELPIINAYGHDKSLGDNNAIKIKKVIRMDNSQGKGSMNTNHREFSCFATNSQVSMPFKPVQNFHIQEALAVHSKNIQKYKINLRNFFESATPEMLFDMKQSIQDKSKLIKKEMRKFGFSKDEIEKKPDVLMLSETIDLIIGLELKEKNMQEKIAAYADKCYEMPMPGVRSYEKKSTQMENEPNKPVEKKTFLPQTLSPNEAKKIFDASGFDEHLNKADHKTRLEKDEYMPEGKKLVENLQREKTKFLRTGQVDEFVEKSRQHIQSSEPILKQSVSWKQILLDLLSAIVFLVSLTLSYWITGKLRLFSEKTSAPDTQDCARKSTPKN